MYMIHQDFIQEINDDFEGMEEEKQYYIDKINTIVKKNN